MIPNRAIIVGSGASIRAGQWHIKPEDLEVWKKIQNEFTIGINWSFKWTTSTINIYRDYQFYLAEQENLKKLPLVFGGQDGFYLRQFKREKITHLHDNIYLLPNNRAYQGFDAWEKGFYSGCLSGIYALNLAIACGCSEIYLLGMDACETEGRTHFYQDEYIGYRKNELKENNGTGIGKDKNGNYNTSIYTTGVNDRYLPLKSVSPKIYNVSVNSKINVFKKISYSEMYKSINKEPNTVNKNNIRFAVLELYKYFNKDSS